MIWYWLDFYTHTERNANETELLMRCSFVALIFYPSSKKKLYILFPFNQLWRILLNEFFLFKRMTQNVLWCEVQKNWAWAIEVTKLFTWDHFTFKLKLLNSISNANYIHTLYLSEGEWTLKEIFFSLLWLIWRNLPIIWLNISFSIHRAVEWCSWESWLLSLWHE